MKRFVLPPFLAALLLLTACEKMNLDDYLSTADSSSGDGCTVTFHVENYEITDFSTLDDYDAATRAVVSASELGTKLSLAIYQDGAKVKQVNQEATDDDFGTVTLNMAAGSYEVAIIVHSCDNTPSMTDLTAISWTPKRVTDTFTYYAPIDVSEATTYAISLSRRVAMYQLTVNKEIPADVAQMEFYYTGGSSTLNIKTGFGSVNSRQDEYRDVTAHEAGQTFQLYTFPHDKTDVLKMTITAIDSAGADYLQNVYEGIPVELNKITTHTTDFFGTSVEGATDEGVRYSLSGDNAWSGMLAY